MAMRRYRSEEEWDAIIKEYKASGTSVEVFSQEHKLSRSSIYRRVQKRSKQTGEFVELPGALSLAQYEVSVKGVTLRIPGNERVSRIAQAS